MQPKLFLNFISLMVSSVLSKQIFSQKKTKIGEQNHDKAICGQVWYQDANINENCKTGKMYAKRENITC